jgi:hypothetical protein
MLLVSDFELSEAFIISGETRLFRFLGGPDPSTLTAFTAAMAGIGGADGVLFEDKKLGTVMPRNFFLGLFAPSLVFLDASESFDALLLHVSRHCYHQNESVVKLPAQSQVVRVDQAVWNMRACGD